MSENKKGPMLLIVVSFIIIIISLTFVTRTASLSVGEFLLMWLFGLPASLLIAYPWYFIVSSISLHFISKNLPISHRTSYVFILSILAFIIDSAYVQLAWPNNALQPQVVLIVVPTLMYLLLNVTFSYTFLDLNKKKSLFFGAIMAVLNTSWIPVILSFIKNDWSNYPTL